MKSIIIIGATSGIGRRVAEIYISRGWRVGVASRRAERLADLVAAAPDRVTAESIDVTSPDSASRLRSLIDRMGDVDIIFNAAGVGFANPSLDPAKEDDIVATNCGGFTRIADEAFNYFARSNRPGQLAAISSIAATRALGVAPAYSASKRFQANYLAALAQLARMRRLPIAVTDIRPGFVDTDLLDKSTRYPMLMDPDRVAAKIVKAIDRRRRVAVINRRWHLVVALWRLIPNFIWLRMPVKLG